MRIRDLLELSGKTILGVNPPVYDFAFFDLWSKPLGLLYLLRRMERSGNRVKLLDMVHKAVCGNKTFGCGKTASFEVEKPIPYKNIRRRYRHFGLDRATASEHLARVGRPDFIFLTSAMTYWYPGVEWMIGVLRECLPGVPIILGGVYARLCPQHAAGRGADFVVAEHWLPDVDTPAMELYGRLPYGVTMTSFGCPLSCSYCASRRLWPSYSRRPHPQVLAEIGLQIGLGASDIAFYDDALLLDKEKYFYPLCRELRSRYGGVRFHTPNGLHVREIDSLCARTLAETGFRTIRLSLESIDPKVSDAGSGKVARGEYALAVKHLRLAGYSADELETYILLGLPGQSAASVRETINFVLTCGAKPKLAEFSPIPGTESFEAAAETMPELRIEPLLHNNSVYSSWFSGTISPHELQELKDFSRSRCGELLNPPQSL